MARITDTRTHSVRRLKIRFTLFIFSLHLNYEFCLLNNHDSPLSCYTEVSPSDIRIHWRVELGHDIPLRQWNCSGYIPYRDAPHRYRDGISILSDRLYTREWGDGAAFSYEIVLISSIWVASLRVHLSRIAYVPRCAHRYNSLHPRSRA